MEPATVRLRAAAPEEFDLLSRIAFHSKAYWGYSERFMEAFRDELSVSPARLRDERFRYEVCEHNGTVVGFFALEHIQGPIWELEALFVDPRFIGQGFGRVLIERAIELGMSMGASKIRIQGDPHAEGFYRAAGAIRVGELESASISGRYLPEFEISLNQEGRSHSAERLESSDSPP